MIVGDSLRMFHRNNGQPVRDSFGTLITVPASDVGMQAMVTGVINDNTVNVEAVDMAGKEFFEEHVYILKAGEHIPRGGRYAIRSDDTSIHPQPTQHGR